MGYPIVNSIEGPLTQITSSDCTEGCITRCILYDGNSSVGPCIIVYVLRLNDDLYLIDSYCQIVQASDFNASRLLVPKLGSRSITTEYAFFPMTSNT